MCLTKVTDPFIGDKFFRDYPLHCRYRATVVTVAQARCKHVLTLQRYCLSPEMSRRHRPTCSITQSHSCKTFTSSSAEMKVCLPFRTCRRHCRGNFTTKSVRTSSNCLRPLHPTDGECEQVCPLEHEPFYCGSDLAFRHGAPTSTNLAAVAGIKRASLSFGYDA